MNAMETEILARLRGPHAGWEGDMLKAYICPAGYLSVGRGHNCEAAPVPGVAKAGDSISPEMLERLYETDCREVFRQLDTFLPWWRHLETPRAAVLFDMCFNMGIGSPPAGEKKGRGLRSFTGTLNQIAAGDYARAAANMRQSQWFRQVRRRAEVMVRQMETGQWQV